MPDHVAMPPIAGCGCWLCTKRRSELQLAERLEREMHDPDLVERDVLTPGEPWSAWRPTPKELAVATKVRSEVW